MFREIPFALLLAATASLAVTLLPNSVIASHNENSNNNPAHSGGQNYKHENVPGPVPLLGVAFAAGWMRQLRNKCTKALD